MGCRSLRAWWKTLLHSSAELGCFKTICHKQRGWRDWGKDGRGQPWAWEVCKHNVDGSYPGWRGEIFPATVCSLNVVGFCNLRLCSSRSSSSVHSRKCWCRMWSGWSSLTAAANGGGTEPSLWRCSAGAPRWGCLHSQELNAVLSCYNGAEFSSIVTLVTYSMNSRSRAFMLVGHLWSLENTFLDLDGQNNPDLANQVWFKQGDI